VALAAVGRGTAAEAFLLHDAGKAAPLGGPADVHPFPYAKNLERDLLPETVGLRVVHRELLHVAEERLPALPEMPLAGLGHALGLDFTEPQLQGVVSVGRRGLDLGHDAGAGLNDGHRNVAAVRGEKPRHPQFFPH